ncbi:MAG: AraC family transcriptional regulator [Ruminococcus sp.]|nr:AraC family transcriptional regulator [Ruminococcus sp.]
MKVRNELNAVLYKNKMEDQDIPKRLPHNSKFISIVNGNIEKVCLELKNGKLALTSGKRILSKNALKNAAYYFVLSVSAISDASMDHGMGQTEACTLSDIYILKADDCKTVDDIYRLYEEMCLDFTKRMQEIRKETVISLHIRKCIDYIYENPSTNLLVKALAETMHLNATYLSRLFRKEMSILLKQFVKEARVDTAKNLLQYSDLSYLVISVSLGFSSQSSFIAVFKEITGVTPKVYREKNFVIHK